MPTISGPRGPLKRHLRAAALSAAALATVLFPQLASAWGALGHRTVAQIAEANVRPATRAAIARLVQASPGLDTPLCPIASLADAAVWPDCIRSDPQRRFAATFPWHYQDIPVCAHSFDPHAGCADGACVTARIAEEAHILADHRRPAVERMRALAFLAHFVGDIHQPLHAADDGDHGGNTETIANATPAPTAGNPNPRPVSLHWFWDDVLVQRALAAPTPSLVHPYSPADRARLGDGDATQWARESWGIARTLAYPQALGRNFCARATPATTEIADSAANADLPLVRRRITQAGLRLARMLDAALGG